MDTHTTHATEKCIANKLTEQKYTTHVHTHTHADDILITRLKCPSAMTRWLVRPVYVYEVYYVVIITTRKYYT